MKTRYPQYPWLDAAYFENRNKFPPEELMQYAGQHIAWSWDGTRILASAETYELLDQKLVAAGHDLTRVVHAFVDPLEDTPTP
jgi:hypothetical protein